MKKLIVIRHGDYNSTGGLTDLGKTQMQNMAEKIKELKTGCMSIRLFSSPAMRARESADIIASRLGLFVEKQNVFYSADGKSNLDGAINFISRMSEEFDLVIVVTHSELAGEIPFYYAVKVLQISKIQYRNVGKGMGVLLDLELETTKFIVP